jgi:hypothetical protein
MVPLPPREGIKGWVCRLGRVDSGGADVPRSGTLAGARTDPSFPSLEGRGG